MSNFVISGIIIIVFSGRPVGPVIKSRIFPVDYSEIKLAEEKGIT